ncbi:MAG: hypothetical protein HPZ91_00920 [Lentisphaeria bacterium]|nr:hypothetical protein [Lentisphaeria bacterium]
MKKWIPCLFIALACMGMQAAEEPVDIYAGRPQLLPFEVKGSFRIRTGHGRILGSGIGSGALTVQLPELEPGSRVEAVLEWEGGSRKIVCHHPLLLPGIEARMALSGPRRAPFLEAGVKPAEKAAVAITDVPEECEEPLMLVFPSRNGLPWRIPAGWRSVSMYRTKNPGSLGVLKVREDSLIDTGGEAAFIEVVTAGKRRIVFFDPKFDPSIAENMLIIQQIVKEMKK